MANIKTKKLRMTDGLKTKHRAAIIDAIATNDRVERAVLFGSRATETYTSVSDVDIAMIGEHLTSADQMRLDTVIEELTVPQQVDLLLYATIRNGTLREHIDRHGVEWYRRQGSDGTEVQYLSPRHWVTLETVLRKHLPGVEAWASGCSRGSDGHESCNLDLVLSSPDQREIPDQQLTDLRQALRNSSLPPHMKVHDRARLPERFRSKIERDRLVLVGKTRPDSGGHWSTVPLSQVAELTLSSVDKKTKLGESAVLLCNYMDVYSNRLIRSDLDFMKATATEHEIRRCRLKLGDVVITKDSERYDDIGVPALVCDDVKDLVCGYHLAILRPIEKTILGSFLFYALQIWNVQSQFHAFANGITRFALRKSDILRVEIPLPALPEQRAIVHVLGSLDKKIEVNRRMNEALEEIAEAIFKDWFIGFGPVHSKMEGREPYLKPSIWNLFPDSLNDETLLPDGWKMERVDQYIQLAYGKALTKKDRMVGDYPVYGSGGITGTHNVPLAKGPGIIVGRKGTVGSLYWEDNDFFAIDTVFHVVPKTQLSFIYYMLQTLGLRHMNTDAAVPGLNRNNVYRLKRSFGCKQTRTAFATLADQVKALIRNNKQESRTLATARNLLLPKLMSGEIRLRDKVN